MPTGPMNAIILCFDVKTLWSSECTCLLSTYECTGFSMLVCRRIEPRKGKMLAYDMLPIICYKDKNNVKNVLIGDTLKQ